MLLDDLAIFCIEVLLVMISSNSDMVEMTEMFIVDWNNNGDLR